MVKFGTDGWRGIIAEDFTFENVRKVALAHAKVLKEEGKSSVLIGYDNRFLSEEFAREVAKVFCGLDFKVYLSVGPCTTPMVSFGVKYLGFDGGVMITASHNPPHYNGYKIKESFGGSATKEFIKKVEENFGEEPKSLKENYQRIDLKGEYLKKVLEFFELETFENFKLIHDCMHGTSRGLFCSLEGLEVLEIRNKRDALFGGIAPEPVERNLKPLMKKVRALNFDLGVANDGDGDRLALCDEGGNYLNPQIIYALILLHLLRNRRERDGVVVKTVSTTFLANRICKKEGVELKEVGVGFKNVNEVILKEKVIFGGEESGGFGFPKFLPERDGFFSALLILEFLKLRGVSLSSLVREVLEEFGNSYYTRKDLRVSEEVLRRFSELLREPPRSLGGFKVKKINKKDGIKFILEDDSWLLLRKSGTEPLLRLYCEGESREEVEELIKEGLKLLNYG